MARRDEEFPVDLPDVDSPDAQPLRWAAVTIFVASLFLLATNAIAIDGWAAELAPGPWTARLNQATAAWREATDAVGLGRPRAVLHSEWNAAQAARLRGQPAAE